MAAAWLEKVRQTGAGILPPAAEKILMDAYARAIEMREGSIERREVIERAEIRVADRWPQFFPRA